MLLCTVIILQNQLSKFRRNGTYVIFVRQNGIRQNGIRQNGLTPCYTSAPGEFLGCMVVGLKCQEYSQIGLLKQDTS